MIMINAEHCSCGAREKNKCSKESEHGCGKMCLKDEEAASITGISLEKSLVISERGRAKILELYYEEENSEPNN
jgi:hypothetical protein